MFFNFFNKKTIKVQNEYIELLEQIMQSSLWDGTDAQLRYVLPKDLNDKTIELVRKKLNKT